MSIKNLQFGDYPILINEWSETIIPSRIEKIYCSTKTNMYLELYHKGEKHNLLIHSSSPGARVHLSTQKPREKRTANPAVLYARKYLMGGFLKDISLYQDDRCLCFTVEQAELMFMYVEMITKKGRFIFCNAKNAVVFSNDPQFLKENKDKEYIIESSMKKDHRKIQPSLPQDPSLSYNQMVEEYFNQLQKSSTSAIPDSFDEKKKYTIKTVQKQKQKKQRLLSNLKKDYDDYQNYDHWNHIGSLILANKHQIKKGDHQLIAHDYYQDPPTEVVIPLDEKMDPVENANRYFIKSRKAKRGLKHISVKIKEIEEELSQLDKIYDEIEEIKNNAQLDPLFNSLISGGIKTGKSGEKGSQPYRQTSSKTGHPIFIGRNAKENQYLFSKISKGNDYWFHCKDYPGGHIYLRFAGADGLDNESLLDCANLAAHYSKLRHSKGVEITYAQRKNLSRKSNMPAGAVMVARPKTITINYDEIRIKRLLG